MAVDPHKIKMKEESEKLSSKEVLQIFNLISKTPEQLKKIYEDYKPEIDALGLFNSEADFIQYVEEFKKFKEWLLPILKKWERAFRKGRGKEKNHIYDIVTDLIDMLEGRAPLDRGEGMDVLYQKLVDYYNSRNIQGEKINTLQKEVLPDLIKLEQFYKNKEEAKEIYQDIVFLITMLTGKTAYDDNQFKVVFQRLREKMQERKKQHSAEKQPKMAA